MEHDDNWREMIKCSWKLQIQNQYKVQLIYRALDAPELMITSYTQYIGAIKFQYLWTSVLFVI
jgi:hypothetical protein